MQEQKKSKELARVLCANMLNKLSYNELIWLADFIGAFVNRSKR